MNNFVVCAVASAAAQAEALEFFRGRLAGQDRDVVRSRFARIMGKSRKGKAPSFAEIDKALKQ